MQETVIGGFTILDMMLPRSGGQGYVYKAVCDDDRHRFVKKGTIVALKVMSAHGDDELKQWRKLEGRTSELARLEHPNVVKYYGCFSEKKSSGGDYYVVVQEFLDGETLKDRLERHPYGLDVDVAIEIIKKAVDGLVYTTAAGIVHRDIKPGNIFLCKDGRVKLIDFEIARHYEGAETPTTVGLHGTLDYMAPEFLDESFRGNVVSDVFSMGVVFHETLSGKLPYKKYDDKRYEFAFYSRWVPWRENGVSPIQLTSRISRLLDQAKNVLDKALDPVKEKRFSDFAEFRKAVENIRFRDISHAGNTYRMLQFVGQGGYGEVFKARIVGNGRLVAIKKLKHSWSADRFKREANIMKKFDSPCFVRFVDFFSEGDLAGGKYYLVMDFLDAMPKGSLSYAIRHNYPKGHKLDECDVLLAFVRYANGLNMLHSSGIFHRDIKPSNLYFPEGHPERAAIMDFGVARDENGTVTTNQFVGTPEYMPPELADGTSRGDSLMDIYALGLCLYEALTGKKGYPPLPTEQMAALSAFTKRAQSGVPPSFDHPRVANDEEMLSLLRDMTNPNPRERIKDAEIVMARICSILNARHPGVNIPVDDPYDPPPSPTPPPRPSPTPQPPLPRRWLRILAIIAAFVGIVVIVYGAFLAKPELKWHLVKIINPRGFFDEFYAEKGKIEDLIKDEPIETRVDRLADAEKALSNVESLFNVAGYRVQEFYDDINDRRKWVVGKVNNECGFDVKVAGRYEIKAGRVEMLTLKDGLPANWTCIADGYKECKLPLYFEGKTITVKESDLEPIPPPPPPNPTPPPEPKPVPTPPQSIECEMKIPDLAPGVTCWFEGRQTNGVLRLQPGRYSCTYRKDWHIDQPVEFVVSAGRHGVIDGPDNWKVKPVPIRLPKLDKGVSCLVDGRPFNKVQTVVTGKHTVVYVRQGYFAQTNEVTIAPAREKVLDPPDTWKPIPKPTPPPPPPPLEVEMKIPELATGVTCWFEGRQTNGVLRLRPGSYSCTYRKDWHFDQTVDFVVSAGRHGVIDGPAKWQVKPVPIRLPKLDKDVSYLIDGLPFEDGATVDIGDHVVAYRRSDYVDQGVKFFVVPAKEKVLDSPGAWTPSEKLAKLNAADERAKKASGIDELEAVTNLLGLADVSSPENIERRDTLKSDVERRLSELINKVREQKRKAVRSKVAEAMKDEPVETRKTRLDGAERSLRQAIAEGLFKAEEVQPNLGDIAKRKNWIVGKIVNNTGVNVKVGNQGIAAGAEEILKFENGLPANLVCAAAWYKDKPLREDFDGATIILSREDLVPEKVEMTIPQLEDGVICIYNDKSVSGKLMLEPGTYSCTYRKECYEDQTFGFEVQFGKPGTVKGPGTWVAKPVPVQSPQLDGEVTCLVDGRSFTAGLTLKVGEHECEYLKSDFKPQQRKFTVVPSSEVVLPKHGEWKPTEALKALKDAEDAVNAKEWSAAADYLKKADVVSKENRKKRDDLDRIVKSKIGVYNLIRSAIDFYDQTVYYDCVSNYYAAAQCGYELSADDVVRVESAYQKEIKEVNKYIKFYEDQIQQELDYNADLKDARERRSNLIKWHTYLVQK